MGWVHGSARFADWDDLASRGWLDPSGKPSPGTLLLGFYPTKDGELVPVRYGGDLHQLIVGGTGGGKFTTALAPMLAGSGLKDNTIVAIDPKGEMAEFVGAYYQEPFAAEASVFLLDPWGQCKSAHTVGLNVLDLIDPANASYVDDARALAEAIIIPSGAENTHWDNAARNFLTAILLYVALDPAEAGQRDLVRVRDIVTMTWAMPKAYTGPARPTLSALLHAHLNSTLAGGAIRRGFSSIFNREDKERSGIISSIERDTAWIDSPPMQKVLKDGPMLDLATIGTGGRKYFIILPPDYFTTHRGWLRLMVATFAKVMKRNRPPSHLPQGQRWRHIVIDEFAALGEMPFVLDDIAIARGFDLKYHLVVQDLAQLERLYKNGYHTLINATVQRYFAISDVFTSKQVEEMMGEQTVPSTSYSRGTSDSTAESHTEGRNISTGVNLGGLFQPAQHQKGWGENTSRTDSRTQGTSHGISTSDVKRALRTADEIRRMRDDEQLLRIRGLPVINCMRPPFWSALSALPPYKVGEVLATIGRAPASAAERHRFSNWRKAYPLAWPRQRSRLSRAMRALRRQIARIDTSDFSPDWDWKPLRLGIVLTVLTAGGFFLALRASDAPTTPSRSAQGSAPALPVRPAPETTRGGAPEKAVATSAPALTPSLDAQSDPTRQMNAFNDYLLAAFKPRLRDASFSMVGGPLDAVGLCQSNDCQVEHSGLWRIVIRGRPEIREDDIAFPLPVSDVVNLSAAEIYDVALPDGTKSAIRFQVIWHVLDDATLREQLIVTMGGAPLKGVWRAAIASILARLGVTEAALDARCPGSRTAIGGDESLGCGADGQTVQRRMVYPYGSIGIPLPSSLRSRPEPTVAAPAPGGGGRVRDSTADAKPEQEQRREFMERITRTPR